MLLFAGVREKADADSVDVPLSPPASASAVIESLVEQIPDAADLIRVSRLAVGGSYVGGDHVIDADDVEVALIPPVSGG